MDTLITQALIGAIKDMLWNTIRSKSRENESLKTKAKALETALASQSIHTTRINIKFDKLIQYIRETYPDADIEDILYKVEVQIPQKVPQMKSYQEIKDELEKLTNEANKQISSTIKL